MEPTKKAITMLLLMVIGLGCIEKDVLYSLHCAIPATAANCNSGADNHNGIHHHFHITDCDALKGSEKSALMDTGKMVLNFPSIALIFSNVSTNDAWQPPKAYRLRNHLA